jgi:hypothetical protein
MEIDYRQKYLKYKLKYKTLQSQIGGDINILYNNIKQYIESFLNTASGLQYDQTEYDNIVTNITDLYNFLSDKNNKNKIIKITNYDQRITYLTKQYDLIQNILNNMSTIQKNCCKNQDCENCKNIVKEKIMFIPIFLKNYII